MKLKSMLKPALATLVVGAGLAAFADGEVLLKDGTPVSWAQFVAGLTGGSSVTGNIADLPAGNTALSNYNTAQLNLTHADQDSTAAQLAFNAADSTLKSFDPANADYNKNPLVQAINDAETDSLKYVDVTAEDGTVTKGIITLKTEAVTAAQTVVGNASSSMDTYNKEYVAPLEEAYNKLVAQRAAKQKSLDSLKTIQTDINTNQIPKATNLLSSYNTTRTHILDSIAEFATTESNTVTAPWLDKIETAANTFSENFTDNVNSQKVYYLYKSESDWTGATTSTLSVAYDVADVDTVPSLGGSWQGPVDQSQFKTFLLGLLNGNETEGIAKVTSITNLNVYLGPAYAAKAKTQLKSAGNGVPTANVVTYLTNAVVSAASDARFQTTTTTTVYPTEGSANWAAYKALLDRRTWVNGKIQEVQNQLTALNQRLEGNPNATNENDKLGIEARITNLTSEIETLDDTTIPAAKTTWENAQKGEGTAELEAAYKAAQEAEGDAATKLEEAQAALVQAQKDQTAANAALTKANANFVAGRKAAQDNYNTKSSELTTAKREYTKAYSAFAQAKIAAQAAADEIAQQKALDNYNEITLTADVTVNQQISGTYSGTIHGDNHVITLQGINYLFNNFNGGHLTSAAINLPKGGKFASVAQTATYTDVAVWDGTSARYYDDEGDKMDPAPATLGALGYLTRDYFGVDFANNQLAALTDATKVYSITVNNSAESNVQSYVTINSADNVKSFVTKGGAAVTIPVNHFASCADDIDGLGLVNVYDSNNTCENVQIVDGAAFYCPVTVQAKSLTYNRTFKAGWNGATLPFAINLNNISNLTGAYTYSQESPLNGENYFWFNKQGEKVAAQTPMLLLFSDDTTLDLSDVAISATTESYVDMVGAQSTDSYSYGMFAKTYASALVGKKNVDHVYGLVRSADGSDFKFQVAAAGEAGKDASFSPFRMAIATTLSAQADGAPRKIRIRDEYGNDITDEEMDGIKSVSVDAAAEVTTAQGQIIISTEADYGTVEVYNLQGKVAATAQVMAGTTSIDVPAGMYIVLGKKVMVK